MSANQRQRNMSTFNIFHSSILKILPPLVLFCVVIIMFMLTVICSSCLFPAGWWHNLPGRGCQLWGAGKKRYNKQTRIVDKLGLSCTSLRASLVSRLTDQNLDQQIIRKEVNIISTDHFIKHRSINQDIKI